MAKRALITGVTGQDGSYLAELLLEQGYEVHGMVRRSSVETFERLEHLRHRMTLHQGDLLDHRSLVDTLRASRPDEIYNLAAMSYVGVSWTQPVLTAEFTGVGVTRMLEAMREVCPEARFYQASSSEMFGKVQEVPQTERTALYPRSPYGVAKCYGHFITVNYRESYDLHLSSGILFNHECCRSTTPLVVRRDGVVEVCTPVDLVPLRREGPSTQSFEPSGLMEVWDGEDFTPVLAITATRHRPADPDHRLLRIEAGGGVVEVTAHHTMLDHDREPVKAGRVEPGDRLALGAAEDGAEAPSWSVTTPEMAEFLGLMCAHGHVDRDGGRMSFANGDPLIRARVAELWSRLFLKDSREALGVSGFDRDVAVGTVSFSGSGPIAPWLREQLYTRTGLAQVPPIVLNANARVRQAFLTGYSMGDGPERGKGVPVETGSPVLAQGLCRLHEQEGRPATVHAEQRAGRTRYRLDLAPAVRVGTEGGHLGPDPAEVRRVVEVEPVATDDFVFDLETESGVFAAGVGRLVVHNSPRRGREFVTRKITWTAAAIKHGLETELRLGNLDAKRDWGYAKDYVEAMWLMLQQPEGDDFVIATGKTHTVKECVEIAFERAGVDWEKHVVIDPAFIRPAEVDLLIGDATKAKETLGWEPRTSFEELITLMVDSDLELLAPR